jgi:hypothetical protein
MREMLLQAAKINLVGGLIVLAFFILSGFLLESDAKDAYNRARKAHVECLRQHVKSQCPPSPKPADYGLSHELGAYK